MGVMRDRGSGVPCARDTLATSGLTVGGNVIGLLCLDCCFSSWPGAVRISCCRVHAVKAVIAWVTIFFMCYVVVLQGFFDSSA